MFDATNTIDKRTTLFIKPTLMGILTILVMSSSVLHAATLPSTQTLSLQNLERERAALIQDILSPKLDVSQRQLQLNKRQRQLSDMERMVMRDERLMNSNSTLVKNAFSNYELTFLVHAGAEDKRTASEQWLSKMSITNEAVLNTQVGFRR